MHKKLLVIGTIAILLIGLSGCADVDTPKELVELSIQKFEVMPSLINEGETTNLSWEVLGAEKVIMDNDIGIVSLSGSRIIKPIKSTTYTLIAGVNKKTVTATTHVIVENLSDEPDDEDTNLTDDNPVAIFDTSMGVFKIDIFEDKMPITCENFSKLVDDGFYKGMIFYRISDDFMIQAGRYFPDESEKFSPYGNINFEESDVKHVDGAISMASTGAGVGGSAEFFICDGAQSFLDGSYAAFGVTIEGLDVVRKIASQPHDNSNPAGGGKPNKHIVINNIIIED